MWNRGHSSDAVAIILPAVVGLCEEISLIGRWVIDV